jgi:phosphate transport system permease protein
MTPTATRTPLAPDRPGTRGRRPGVRKSSLFAHGEPLRWLTAGALVACLAMIVGLLALVFGQGLTTFWPVPYVELETPFGTYGGEVTKEETFRPTPAMLSELPEGVRAKAAADLERAGGTARRRHLRVGNFELTGEHFKWVSDFAVSRESLPEWGVVVERIAVVERLASGRLYGKPRAFLLRGERVATTPEAAWELFRRHHDAVRERWRERRHLETAAMGDVNARLEAARLDLRNVELRHGRSSAEWRAAKELSDGVVRPLEEQATRIRRRIDELNATNDGYQLVFETSDGKEVVTPVADVVRAYPANRLSTADKWGIYLSRWGEFLTDEPRDANLEGGVFPAIFGTVVMTLLMSLAVVPFGVLAALYLREYAKRGPIVSAVRIAVNNLAGVPSIVFGVFGLGFFCYLIGSSIDELFFEARLPSPTFGTGGIIWASLTLALLTLPVVIVATEESLAAVPSSMREGSYACGASKWQTIRRIVLPRAMPGIMTGMILAMARGAGEVAPLMLVGAVKLAPSLPVDGAFPFVHVERSFMHLGFHIYDLGFQSQNSEAARPMVYTTTVLLILIIVVLNLAAVFVRSRLRRRFVVGHF